MWKEPQRCEDVFDSDEEAFEAFELTVNEEGMDAFFERNNVIPFPTRK